MKNAIKLSIIIGGIIGIYKITNKKMLEKKGDIEKIKEQA